MSSFPIMDVLSQLLQHKIIAIVRGVRPQDVLPIADALHSGGIRLMEITLNSAGALDLIRQLSITMKDKMLIGAGTVLDAGAAAQAIKSGARFIIAPSLDVATIKRTKDLGGVSIPGAYTATEVLTAFKAGGDIIKIFPASQPQYIKDLRGPLDHIPMMPTGGVTLENIAAFQRAGAVAFGIGSNLVDAQQPVTSEYLHTLTTKAAQFVLAVNKL